MLAAYALNGSFVGMLSGAEELLVSAGSALESLNSTSLRCVPTIFSHVCACRHTHTSWTKTSLKPPLLLYQFTSHIHVM